jgi:hypothetical protein
MAGVPELKQKKIARDAELAKKAAADAVAAVKVRNVISKYFEYQYLYAPGLIYILSLNFKVERG